MRAVIQRVTSSDVTVDGVVTGAIGKGLVVLLGVEDNDDSGDVEYMADKIPNLRIFEDSEGKMNLSLVDVGGDMLVISQFTLFGDCRKGRRPGFTQAARPEKANALYREFIQRCSKAGIHIEEGVFQAEMLVRINNDGPVTIIMDSKKTF